MQTTDHEASPPIRVLIADDHEGIRKGLHALLDYQEDMTVIGEAVDGAMAVEMVTAQAPEVVIMDIRMPVMDGIEATRHILARAPETKVLLVSSEAPERIDQALRSGAQGFIGKGSSLMAVPNAIREVLKGNACIAP